MNSEVAVNSEVDAGPAPARPPIGIAGFGEAMVLLQPESGPLATARRASVHVAGAELNLCAAATRAGVGTAWCSRVGDDPLGTRVLAAANALGVGTDLVATDAAHPTGLFLKDIQPDGERRVYYYRRGSAASAMDTSDTARLLAARPRIVAVSGVTAALGPGPSAAVRALVGRPRGTMLAFDPNFRPALGPVDEQVAFARELLPAVDFLLLGLDEAEPLFGTAEPGEVFARARALGVTEVVLKAGADGCYYPAGTGVAHLPSLAETVVDPVGGGDALAGAYLAARLRGASPAGAAWLGSRFAAGVVAALGDTEGLPTLAQARALIESVMPTVAAPPGVQDG